MWHSLVIIVVRKRLPFTHWKKISIIKNKDLRLEPTTKFKYRIYLLELFIIFDAKLKSTFFQCGKVPAFVIFQWCHWPTTHTKKRVFFEIHMRFTMRWWHIPHRIPKQWHNWEISWVRSLFQEGSRLIGLLGFFGGTMLRIMSIGRRPQRLTHCTTIFRESFFRYWSTCWQAPIAYFDCSLSKRAYLSTLKKVN